MIPEAEARVGQRDGGAVIKVAERRENAEQHVEGEGGEACLFSP